MVTPDMRVVREEIFGPVGALMSFTDVDDAVSKANQTEYGLASSVWTKDLVTAHRVADGIDAGTVWVNTHHEMTTGAMVAQTTDEDPARVARVADTISA